MKSFGLTIIHKMLYFKIFRASQTRLYDSRIKAKSILKLFRQAYPNISQSFPKHAAWALYMVVVAVVFCCCCCLVALRRQTFERHDGLRACISFTISPQLTLGSAYTPLHSNEESAGT